MGIFNTVAKARRWLVAGWRKIRRNRELMRALMKSLGVSEKIQRRVERYFEKMDKVEELHGAVTAAYRKVETNVKAGAVVDPLDLAEYRYLYFAKKAFDDTIRPIGLKAVDHADEVELPVPDVPDVEDLTAEEDDDANLSVPED